MSVMILLDHQGLLKGDLNSTQRLGLSWLVGHSNKEKLDLEKYRAINTALATNPGTSGEFLKQSLEEFSAPVEIHETDPKWTTPQSREEIEAFLKANGLA